MVAGAQSIMQAQAHWWAACRAWKALAAMDPFHSLGGCSSGARSPSLACKLLEGLLDALRRQLPAPQPLAALHLPIPLAVHLQVPGWWAVWVGTVRRGGRGRSSALQAQCASTSLAGTGGVQAASAVRADGWCPG